MTRMVRRPGSFNIKFLLFLFALAIVVGVLFYTNSIIRKLERREHQINDLYASALQYVGSDQALNGDLSFVFDEIINNKDSYPIDFPVILTDADGTPISWRNLDIDSSLDREAQLRLVLGLRDELAAAKPPLVIKAGDSTIIHYIYFDESTLIRDLRNLPFYEFLLASMFILLGYVAFSYIKRTEQANIWVGMSRETAHQLGTPLSSLMGWIDLMRTHPFDEHQDSILTEMEQDIQRLNLIAHRFSKIGSQPELVRQDASVTIQRVVEYMRKRTPRLGRKVEIHFSPPGPVMADYNGELLDWVLENLIKNALDAIDSPEGRIVLLLSGSNRSVTIDVADNGKGIEKRHRKDIFRPGFSTKKRGWGLGLSLSKRIIENYHNGRLSLVESAPGKGTRFRIRLPASPTPKH